MTLPRSLFGRLLLVFLLFGTAMTGALVYVLRVSHHLYHMESDQTVNRDLAQQYVASNFLLTDKPLTAQTLHQGIGRLAAANPAVDIYLLDSRGGIVATSVAAPALHRTRVDLKPVRDFVRGQPVPIFGNNPRTAAGQDVFSAATFHLTGCPADFLYVVLGRGEDGPGASQLRRIFALREGAGIVLLATVLSIALSLMFLRLLTRRLSTLETAMNQFHNETNESSVSRRGSWLTVGGDEVDRLEALFRDLAQRVDMQLRALYAMDAARRDMLSNLSHDLRTPLTTLLAHLESLQIDSSLLSSSERNEYVAVSMRQAQRVAQLVEQVLEAAKLEAKQVPAHLEEFPIGDLLQDIVQKFSLAVRERDVALDLEVTPAGLQVFADVALLERVFDNLIDNALRHTPPGGRVTVTAHPHGDNVRLAVSDSGAGMTRAEADRIFDRFYRGDLGRSTRSGQAGLGLAIVKSILELHDATIEVDTSPGQGASFYFELQATQCAKSISDDALS